MLSASRPLYRARQFFVALRPRLEEAERAEAASVLGPELWLLFDSMSARDQRHCLDVYRVLRSHGCEDKDLLMAALLHDAGKGRLAGTRVRLWQRVAYVLLGTAAPGMLNRLVGTGSLGRLTGGLRVLHQHAERGAELAAALGAPAEVVELVRDHEDGARAGDRSRLLRAADDSC